VLPDRLGLLVGHRSSSCLVRHRASSLPGTRTASIGEIAYFVAEVRSVSRWRSA
jgi:hypothetical protein